jgi:hypothetical protein
LALISEAEMMARRGDVALVNPKHLGTKPLKESLRHRGNRVPTALLFFNMAPAGHAVFDFGTEGTLKLRFNAL